MYLMPANAGDVATIVSMDPGTQHLGFAVISFSVTSLQIVSTQAFSFSERNLSVNPWLAQTHSERFARIEAQRLNILHLLRIYRPFAVRSESPFFSVRFPQAYGALTEVVSAIRYAVLEYDQFMELELIDPPSVKNSVGAPGNADKEKVKAAVLALPDLNYCGEIPLEFLDEHSIDAIAVGYSRISDMRKKGSVWL